MADPFDLSVPTDPRGTNKRPDFTLIAICDNGNERDGNSGEQSIMQKKWDQVGS